MEKLDATQRKLLWYRILAGLNITSFQSHAEWATKHFSVEVTEEDISAFYSAQITREPVMS